jgi:F-type H+-transporting ATPase subunit a
LTALIPALLSFEEPGTDDFVWTPYFNLGPIEVNLIIVLTVATTLLVMAFFFFALRKKNIVPGRLQTVAEEGIGFIRNSVIMEVIGPEGLVFLPFFTAIFFYILFGNLFEVLPWINTTMNSRIMFPLILAMPVWIIYNTVGIRKHGWIGYLKLQTIPPGVPTWLLIVTLLPIVEFISNIIVRPLSLAIRLFANMMAGHFLIALVFGATILAANAGMPVAILTPIPFALSVGLVAVEIFVSVLQAFIFVILSATYIQGALASEH